MSWIRRSDVTLLTVGETRYTHDERFTPIHAARKSDSSSPELDVDAWILQITHARVEDSGDYECQVSYHDDMEKKLKMPFTLKVLGKCLLIAVRIGVQRVRKPLNALTRCSLIRTLQRLCWEDHSAI